MSVPVNVNLGSVESLRRVFDLEFARYVSLDQEIRHFFDVLTRVIQAAKSEGVYMGVCLRSAGDLDSVD